MAYNLRTNEILLHGKFQPPNFNGVAVHRSQTEVQTKRGLSNICLDRKSSMMLYLWLKYELMKQMFSDYNLFIKLSKSL